MQLRITSLVVFVFGVALLVSLARSQTRPASTQGFERWEKEISVYEQKDRTAPPPKQGIEFTGASTIRMWKTLEQDFPGHSVFNRGFGGSQIADATHFADRIIIPYEPKMIFLRSGGNDIHAGKSVEQVFTDFKDFVTTVRTKLPDTQIVFISLSPAPARWNERDANKQLNDLVRDYCKEVRGLRYVETYDMTLTPDGKAREELFVADKLHFNAEGYKLLAERVRPFLPK
jgi:lysophospholipase L1-like esterase